MTMDGISKLGMSSEKMSFENQNVINTNAVVHNNVKDLTQAGQPKKKLSAVEDCETCKNRSYQDGSNDPGVSFKMPTKLSPSQAAVSVRSHEMEHFSRENAKAEREDKEVVSNNVRVFTSVCPECGKTYVSGGETKTVTVSKEEDSFAKRFYNNTVGKHRGKEIDVKA